MSDEAVCERCAMRAPAGEKLCRACAGGGAVAPSAVLEELERGTPPAQQAPAPLPEGALTRRQIAIWSVVLGGIAVAMVLPGLTKELSNAPARPSENCFVYLDAGGSPDLASKVPLFPDVESVKGAIDASRDADDRRFKMFTGSATAISPGTKARDMGVGPGYLRVKILDGDAEGASGYVFFSACHPKPPR